MTDSRTIADAVVRFFRSEVTAAGASTVGFDGVVRAGLSFTFAASSLSDLALSCFSSFIVVLSTLDGTSSIAVGVSGFDSDGADDNDDMDAASLMFSSGVLSLSSISAFFSSGDGATFREFFFESPNEEVSLLKNEVVFLAGAIAEVCVELACSLAATFSASVFLAIRSFSRKDSDPVEPDGAVVAFVASDGVGSTFPVSTATIVAGSTG